jgi:hypothetical protein
MYRACYEWSLHGWSGGNAGVAVAPPPPSLRRQSSAVWARATALSSMQPSPTPTSGPYSACGARRRQCQQRQRRRQQQAADSGINQPDSPPGSQPGLTLMQTDSPRICVGCVLCCLYSCERAPAGVRHLDADGFAEQAGPVRPAAALAAPYLR